MVWCFSSRPIHLHYNLKCRSCPSNIQITYSTPPSDNWMRTIYNLAVTGLQDASTFNLHFLGTQHIPVWQGGGADLSLMQFHFYLQVASPLPTCNWTVKIEAAHQWAHLSVILHSFFVNMHLALQHTLLALCAAFPSTSLSSAVQTVE